MIISCWQQSLCDSGLVVWFSHRMREVPGPIPGSPQRRINELSYPNSSILLHIFEKLYEKQYAPQMTKNL